MDPTKIVELVRDYLFLTSRFEHRKTEYHRRIRLLSRVLTDMIDCDCVFGRHESTCARKVVYEQTEWADALFNEYIHLLTECLSDHLEDRVKPYVCPGSGDTYRNYTIDYKESILTVKCVGEKPSEGELKEWFDETFYYPLEVKTERVESVTGGPTWRPYFWRK